jgi:diguanylate cyclase (GGDEF)-like protein
MELKRYPMFETLQKGSPLFLSVIGIALVSLVGMADYLSGNKINVSLFYLVPIVLVTWAVNQTTGLFLSILSALSWLAAESTGITDTNLSVYFWNTFIHAGFFITVTYLVAKLQKARREERRAARTDFISGAVNARYFNELLQMEIDRIRRYPHPITVVYIDIDNFKLVNDLFGHSMGDEVLRCIVHELKSQLRSTDIIARVGGDEFSLLLPSTRQPEAEVVLSKVRPNLLAAMQRRNWPVTFSMGAVTCVTPPYSVEQIINMADELMYEVKNSTKNDVRFATWGGRNGRY